jgi:hypothetical protein
MTPLLPEGVGAQMIAPSCLMGGASKVNLPSVKGATSTPHALG